VAPLWAEVLTHDRPMREPTMVPVDSSSIRAIGYDPAHRVLYVEFFDGDVYSYEGVEELIHRRLVRADSIGGFFNREIRNAYDCHKL
jgi:hypothetical protein